MAFMRLNGGFSDGTNGGDTGVDLSLGLSLNGQFGVDPTIPRSATAPAFLTLGEDRGNSSQLPAAAVPMRAHSMPSEVEVMPSEAEVESHRRQKEIQTMNRLVARKRQLEKRNSRQLGKGHESDDANSSQEAVISGGDDVHGVSTNDAPPRLVRSKTGSSSAVAKGDVHGHGIDTGDAPSKRSVGIQVGSSSPIKASSGNKRLTPAPAQAQKKSRNEPKPPRRPVPKSRANNAAKTKEFTMEERRPVIPNQIAAENVAAPAENQENVEMPSCSAVGPSGRKIDGFLYKYAQRNPVIIMCVCHGHFMSPAQFIQHAGGVVEGNGLQQITVRPANSVIDINP